MRALIATFLLAACAAGGGQKIASACAPNTIVVDGATLFWLDVCNGSIMSLAAGSATPSALATAQSRPASLVADGAHLYWIDYTTDTAADIRAMAKDGGTVTTLATNESSPDTVPGRLVVDDTNVYWVTTSGELRSVSKQGAQPRTIASSPRLSTPAVDGDFVYWSEGASLMRQPKLSGSIDVIVQDASTDTFTSDLLVASGRLYYRVVYSVGEGSFGMWTAQNTPSAQPTELPIDAQDVGRASMVLRARR